MHRVLLGTSRNVEETSKHGEFGRHQTCSKEGGFKLYQTRSNAIIVYDTLPACCISKGYHFGNWRNQIRESICVTSTSPEDVIWRQLDERIGFRSCWRCSRLQQTQPKTKHLSVRTGRPVLAEQSSGSSAQEIDKRVLLGSESTNERTRRLVFQLCASVCWTFRSRQGRRRKRRSRSCKNGETRWKWTIHRLLHTARGNRHWLQSVWIATCSCETSRRLPCSRTREEDRESSSSTRSSRRFATK